MPIFLDLYAGLYRDRGPETIPRRQDGNYGDLGEGRGQRLEAGGRPARTGKGRSPRTGIG